MEWSKIFNLHTWTPLSEIDGDVEQIADGIYRVATNTYVQTQPYNKNFEEDDPRSPFVTKAYWSSSVDSLKRVVLGDPSLGSKPLEVSIPEELRLETKGEYSALLKLIPKGEEKSAERAIYSNKGEFLFKLMKIGRLNYCFLSNKQVEDERTFLIEVSLLK